MKKTILALFTVAILAFTLQGCNHSSKEKKTGQNGQQVPLQCPMDCENGRTYDKTGQCPVCGMDLEKAPVQS